MISLRKKRYAALLLAVIVLACIHLLLKFRSQQVFSTLVRELSKGELSVETEEVDISYLPFGVEVHKLRLRSSSEESVLREVGCDELRLHIESVFGFLLHRKLDLNEFIAIRPAITLKGTKDRTMRSSWSVREMQEEMLEIFNLLKAERVRLEDCSFRIEYGNEPWDYFSINRFSLSLDDFHLDKKSGSSSDPFHGKASFSMKRPEIHLADTNLSIGVHEISLDKTSSSLRIDSLEILVKDEDLQYEGMRLASVSVKNLNWQRFLEEGHIEIDSAEVASGSASLNLSRSERGPVRMKKKRRNYSGSPVTVHYVAINDISYSLLMNDYLGKKDKKVLFSIQGEKFAIDDLTLDPSKTPAISAKEIDVRLKDYTENDADDSYAVSLGSVKFNKGNLTLHDYLLQPKNPKTASHDNKVKVPELRVEDLSLEELLMRRVDARRLVVTGPEVVVDLKKNRKDKKKSASIDASIARIMEGLEERVAVSNVLIENGALRLQSTDSSGQDVVISGVTLNLSGGRAVKSRSLQDALRAIDEFRTDVFTISGPSVSLKVEKVRWLPDKSGIIFSHVSGKIGDDTNVDLFGLRLLLKKRHGTEPGMIEFSEIRADSGDVVISGGKETGRKKKSSLPLKADKVRLDHIDISYRVGGKILATSRVTVSVDDLSFSSQKKLWSRIYLSGIRNLFEEGETLIEAEQVSAEQPGTVSFIGVKGRYVSKRSEVRFSAEEFRIDGEIDPNNTTSSRLHSMLLEKPTIEGIVRLGEKQSVRKKEKELSIFPAIPHIVLNDPRFSFILIGAEGDTVTRSQSLHGKLVLDSVRMVREDSSTALRIGKLTYDSDELSGAVKNRYFNPSRLHLGASDLRYDVVSRKTTYRIDVLRLENFQHRMAGADGDTTEIYGGSLELRDWLSETNDPPDWKTLLKSVRWTASGIGIIRHDRKNRLELKGIHAAHDRDFRWGFDELSIEPRGSREDFWQNEPFEKDHVTLSVKNVECSGADVDFLSEKPSLHINNAVVGQISIKPQRDKTRPEDTVSYRPLLCRQIVAIPFPLSIDSVRILDGSLEYHEIGQRTSNEGVLSITKLNGHLLNIRNHDIGETDSLIVRMNASLYDQGNLRLHFRQSYNDTLQGFWMRMRLSGFDMSRMNAILSPLMRIELVSGVIDTMTILVKGNDLFSFGTIDMRYNDLFVCLRSDGKKKSLLHRTADWAANLYIRNSDNGKPNLLFRRRILKRGQFNFWGKIAVEGLLSNIGIKRDEAERKAFEAALRTFELPTDYWGLE